MTQILVTADEPLPKETWKATLERFQIRKQVLEANLKTLFLELDQARERKAREESVAIARAINPLKIELARVCKIVDGLKEMEAYP